MDDFGVSDSYYSDIRSLLATSDHVHYYEAIPDDERPLPSLAGHNKFVVNLDERLSSIKGDVHLIEGNLIRYLEFLLDT